MTAFKLTVSKKVHVSYFVYASSCQNDLKKITVKANIATNEILLVA